MSAKRKAWIYSVRALMTAATGITLALALFLVVYVLAKGLPNLSFELLTTAPSYLSGRVGRPEDIARACLYLTAAGNDFVNGINIIIDGGMTRKMIYEP